ncbi:DUF6114 domain-containing protein [Streptomyces sp. NPDC050485]|uniref:DUF6114 domain-containing protein n=1 Tax=Streptomyces sp. NPDC050485 TaxID=3365617 RepID=UPI0037B92CD3
MDQQRGDLPHAGHEGLGRVRAARVFLIPRRDRTYDGRGRCRARPFAAACLVTAAAVEMIALPFAAFPVAITVPGVATNAGLGISLPLLLTGWVLYAQPQLHAPAGLAAVGLALAALVACNLGGFLMGSALGVVGGALAFAWREPRPPADPPSAARTASGRDRMRRLPAIALLPLVLLHSPLSSPRPAPLETAARCDGPQAYEAAAAACASPRHEGTLPPGAGTGRALTVRRLTVRAAFCRRTSVRRPDGRPLPVLHCTLTDTTAQGVRLTGSGRSGPSLSAARGRLTGTGSFTATAISGRLVGVLPFKVTPERLLTPVFLPSLTLSDVRADLVDLQASSGQVDGVVSTAGNAAPAAPDA